MGTVSSIAKELPPEGAPMAEEIAKAHTRRSPSGFAQIMACPGSLTFAAQFPDSSSAEAGLGTGAHYVLLEVSLPKAVRPSELLGQTFTHERGEVTVDHEMASALDDCYDYIESIVGDKYYEVRVDISEFLEEFGLTVEGEADQISGTADCVIVVHEADGGYTLHALDLKYGKGVQVYAHNNAQLKGYALGVVNELECLYAPFKKVVLHILQPRLNHYDEETLDRQDLLDWAETVLVPGLNAANDPDAPRVPGETQCQFCRGKAHCPELADHNMKVMGALWDEIEADNPPTPIEPSLLDTDDIAKLLPHLDLITGWVKAIEARAMAEVMGGNEIEGYKLVEGGSRRSWKDEAEAEAKLKAMRGVKLDDFMPRKLCTAPQAEKILGKKKFNEKCADLVHKPKGRPQLAKANDRRPLWVPDDSLFDDESEEFPSTAEHDTGDSA